VGGGHCLNKSLSSSHLQCTRDIMLYTPSAPPALRLQEDGSYALEDEAGSVAIDLSGAQSAAGLVTGQ
jgi:hypothetical protein